MQKFITFACFFFALGLVSCRDYSNRIYHYNEPIPATPFVMKVTQVEHQSDDKQLLLKVTLEIQNRSFVNQTLNKNRFILRSGEIEIPHDKIPDFADLHKISGTQPERLEAEAIPFDKEEKAIVTVQFTTPPTNQRLDLIVDKVEKHGKSSLTLVNLKDDAVLKPTSEWQKSTSPHWN